MIAVALLYNLSTKIDARERGDCDSVLVVAHAIIKIRGAAQERERERERETEIRLLDRQACLGRRILLRDESTN